MAFKLFYFINIRVIKNEKCKFLCITWTTTNIFSDIQNFFSLVSNWIECADRQTQDGKPGLIQVILKMKKFYITKLMIYFPQTESWVKVLSYIKQF